ncbi:helix-turn-helix transcriptional regulator [Arthrobacter livingstonensis]|uniref:Helix-turn-helix transcriptional regulator n=1 Tax=Arthrobacter livingstonensis TaxID=670078 RepID=A0A2V5L7V5_9MICC|nr:LuxR C-terminal-related transcriptional regulator [Arthrobacter livingstonensis]PYI66404.1 helix-turn-helix transcriptional regulator [Arthrobacter livingstonensis]
MAAPLLETKLIVPRRRRSLVARPRLRERLDRAGETALTLVSAPAGFGKTTVLTEWLASRPEHERPAAWLSLDPRDNDPVVFWTYLITALGRAAPGIGATALPLLQPPAPPIESLLSLLLNDVASSTDELVLVLDDYHVIHSQSVQEGMDFLVQNLPPQFHVVVAGRADPALPLARLRGRGALVEVRAADLRFTPGETAEYLNEVMGLTLAAADIAALDGRTEGWIAALQLAALSLQGREDAAGFIAGFTGDDRYVVDYLAEEVLRGLPGDVRDFLLQTSILERLGGPLCDAVTGQAGGQATLDALERGNLFLTPLDAHRTWYRYHQLFADVLRARLLDEHRDQLPQLHGRASIWWEQNGEAAPAILHALAAEDFERAADLMERAVPAMRRSRSESSLLSWLKLLPEELFGTRPVLSVSMAGALLAAGETTGVEERLLDAERWLGPAAGGSKGRPPAPAMVVVDEEEFHRLPAAIDLYRAALALTRGNLTGAARHASRALDASPLDDHLGRAAASGLLGLAAWTGGDLESGIRGYQTCVAGLQRAGHIADTFGCTVALTDLSLAQGRLSDAMRTCRQAMEDASGPDGLVLRGTADLHVAMSGIHLERNDIPAATAELQRSRELGEHLGLPQNPYRWQVAMAGIRAAEGDPRGALELLDEAGRVYISDFFPQVRPIPALRARVLAGQGLLGEAFGWVREVGITADDEPSYLREFEHITLARLLLARHATEGTPGALDDAAALLERLLAAADAGRRTGSTMEILVLRSLAQRAGGDIPAALASLQRALALAEPEGYVRLFANEGAPMASLLGTAAKQGMTPAYARRLRAAAGALMAPAQTGLIEPLSERELDVLRLLATDLDGPNIARELMVSLNTVRTHTSHIYAKLGVNSRQAALRRAGELNLLSRKG